MHAGQGSANRRFFFENAYLELLWIDDPAAAKREPARRTRLWERWRRRDASACPFGIAFRPLDPAAETLPPFPTWAYHAPYLPAQVSIGIALATPLSEPEFLYLPFATRPDAKGREPIAHPAGLRQLTGVRIGLPPSTMRSQAGASGCRSRIARVVRCAGIRDGVDVRRGCGRAQHRLSPGATSARSSVAAPPQHASAVCNAAVCRFRYAAVRRRTRSRGAS